MTEQNKKAEFETVSVRKETKKLLKRLVFNEEQETGQSKSYDDMMKQAIDCLIKEKPYLNK